MVAAKLKRTFNLAFCCTLKQLPLLMSTPLSAALENTLFSREGSRYRFVRAQVWSTCRNCLLIKRNPEKHSYSWDLPPIEISWEIGLACIHQSIPPFTTRSRYVYRPVNESLLTSRFCKQLVKHELGPLGNTLLNSAWIRKRSTI